MEWYFLPIILLVGAITTYTDVTHQKIRNRHLLIIHFIIVILYSVLLTTHRLPWSNVYPLNYAVAIILGFILCYLDLWKAGDAKLFATYAALLPMNHYAPVIPFSSLVLFATTFTLGTVFVLTSIIITNPFVRNKVFTSKLFKNIIVFAVNSFSLYWIFGYIFSFLKIQAHPLVPIILIYLLTRSTRKWYRSRNQWLIVTACLLILKYFLVRENFFHMPNLIYITLTSLIFRMVEKSPRLKERIPYAPFLLVGALLTNTKFLFYILKGLSWVRK